MGPVANPGSMSVVRPYVGRSAKTDLTIKSADRGTRVVVHSVAKLGISPVVGGIIPIRRKSFSPDEKWEPSEGIYTELVWNGSRIDNG